MPSIAIKKSSKRKVVNKKVEDFSNDPFVVKKAKEAEVFLKKQKLPLPLSKR